MQSLLENWFYYRANVRIQLERNGFDNENVSVVAAWNDLQAFEQRQSTGVRDYFYANMQTVLINQ